MDVHLHAALMMLVAVAGAAAVVVRWWPAPAARSHEKVLLWMMHGVCAMVAASAAFCVYAGVEDALPLALCGATPLVVLLGQDTWGVRLSHVALPLMLLGIALQLAAVVHVVDSQWLGAIAAVACALFAAAVGRRTWRTAEQQTVPRRQRQRRTQGFVLHVLAVGVLLCAWPTAPAGSWALLLAALCAWATAARMDGGARPPLVVVVPALMSAASLLLVLSVLDVLSAHRLALTLWALTMPLSWSQLIGALPRAGRTVAVVPTSVSALVASPGAPVFAAMSPLLDESANAHAQRARIVSRVFARRVLEAALDRARGLQSIPQGVRSRDFLRIDLQVQDGDIDVDVDVADLAEALVLVLDQAMRTRQRDAQSTISVVMRGAAHIVTFDICDAPSSMRVTDEPDDAERQEAFVRARALVERSGGRLAIRREANRGEVHISLPRRVVKSTVGIA